MLRRLHLLQKMTPYGVACTAGRRLFLLTTGAAWLAGVGSACSTKAPIRVGFLGGLSGRVSDLGIGGRNGTQLAVDDLNAGGGLDGRRLELLTRDDEQNGEVARQRLGELLDQRVEWVIGPMTSAVAAAVLPLVNERRVPMISPLAGANDFSGRDDAFFRVVSDAAAGGRQQAQALLKRGLRRIVTVADTTNAVFTRNWVVSAREKLEAGGAVVQALEFKAAPGLKFLELAQRIAGTDVDGVIIAASAADSAVLVQQVRRLRERMFIALSVWAGTEELPALAGRALDGVLVTQFFDRFNAAPRWLDFVARYGKRFGEAPGYAAMNGYDALQMGAAAWRAAGRAAGRDGLLQALRRVRDLDGLQRKLHFDEFGDCLAPTYLTEVKDGRYVAVSA